MKKLKGDLEADAKHRATMNTPYIETELMHILKCIVEALMYAKLRVIFS